MLSIRSALLCIVAVLLARTALRAESRGAEMAEKARDILQKYCVECHAGPKPRGGFSVLNYADLVSGVVKPEQAKNSELLTLVRCGVMPPGDRPKVPSEAVSDLEQWIEAGAPAFPPRASEAYVLRKIRDDYKALKGMQDPNYQRYISFNHLLALDNPPSPETCRAALAAALNHLSQRKGLVRPVSLPGDGTGTIFRINLRELGWEANPFHIAIEPKPGEKPRKREYRNSEVNVYDLLLLEYPFAVIPRDSDVWRDLEEVYLRQNEAPFVRPIPYLRGDWLAALALQSPLYEDLLAMPRTLADSTDDMGKPVKGLETKLAVKGDRLRAGVTNLHGRMGNRLLERREGADGPFWRTYELDGSRGPNELMKRLDETTSGGMVLYSLPNGLLASGLFDSLGRRLDAVPSNWLSPLDDGPRREIRNGLACIRCHAAGPAPFDDEAHGLLQKSDRADKAKLLERYPSGADWKRQVEIDARRCSKALEQAHEGKWLDKDRNPLAVVARLYQDSWMHAPNEADAVGASRRRNLWLQPDLMDPRLDRSAADGLRVLPLDGVTCAQYDPRVAGVRVLIQTWDAKADAPRSVFNKGDLLEVHIKNEGADTIYIELTSLSLTDGRAQAGKDLIEAGTPVPPRSTVVYPPKGEDRIKLMDVTGKDALILFASKQKFEPGILLESKSAHITDRILHPFYARKGAGRVDPAAIVKRTIEFETR
jgi:serine/threonine-protein kinase